MVTRTIALLLVAALLGVLIMHFVPRPRLPGEEMSAWDRTDAARLITACKLWGASRDLKRAWSSESYSGGDVFLFTEVWGALLDERLMPQTKFRDFTRQEHVAYLLPGTGRRPIAAPRGSADKRPPVIVGYGLAPSQLKPGPLPQMPQQEHTGSIVLDEGHTLGQTFVTFFDYDVLDAAGLIVVSDEPTVAESCGVVLYNRPDDRRIIARASRCVVADEEGTAVLRFAFDRPPRLRYNRGNTPYLLEITWRRPQGYRGPGPAFGLAERDAYRGGEMVVDGERRPRSDLAFTVIGTHTDVEGYHRVLPLRMDPDEAEWPGLFFAVRQDLPQPEPPETLPDYFGRLNEFLLQP